jgi:molybdopterin-binding protein
MFNQLKGNIVEVKTGATASDLRIDIDNGVIITSAITNEAVAELNLKRRRTVSPHQGIRHRDRNLTRVSRRVLIAGASAALIASSRAWAATVTDGAGRSVPVPARVDRVFPAGPPAAIMLYTLAPDLLLGWPRANRADEREFLLPDVGARPEVGRITIRAR